MSRQVTEAVEAVRCDWLTVPEIAKWIKTGDRSIYKAIKTGKLRAVSVNARGDLRSTPSWVMAWLESGASQ
jgi:excisionase family DNA binding protein